MARRIKGLATPKAARRRERKRKAGIQVRRKKEFTYRGMTIDKLQELNFEDFIKIVQKSRGAKLKDPEKNNIFTGEFWTGKASLKLGLIDGIGNADQVLKDKFGDKVIIKTFEKPKGFIARKLSSSFQDPHTIE